MTFKELGIQPRFIKALAEMEIFQPSEIQEKALPYLLQQQEDFIGQAQTGTGKTLAFGIPVLQKVNPDKNQVQALVLAPTRELCQQIAKQLFKFTKFCDHKIFTEAVYGGEKIHIQIGRLKRPTHVVVATPGRLMDLLEQKAIDLTGIETVVLDEADEMLSMGFKEDISKILSFTQGHRKLWLFSATMPAGILQIITEFMASDAYKVEVDASQKMNRAIAHHYVVVDLKDKVDVLSSYLKKRNNQSGIIFCNTKAGSEKLANQLKEKGITTGLLHGDMGQRDREKVMRMFKSKRTAILVATDVSARGIDVADLTFVIHFQLPDQQEYFTHRSGRTARAGKSGVSLALVAPSEMEKIEVLEDRLNIAFEQVYL